MKRLNRSIAFLYALIPFLALGTLRAQAVRIEVTNPSATDRFNEPVVIEWKRVVNILSASEPEKLRLIDENGRSLAFQLDDLEQDGAADELAFTTDIERRGKRIFHLAVADTLAPPIGPLRTDAGNWKKIGGTPQQIDDDDGPGLLRNQSTYVYDGVGWESELIGYRLYLDERNAIDIQGKREPSLHWNFIGKSGVNYQLDAHWGMDVLHVGSSLGFGGIGFWEGEAIVKPVTLDRRRCRVIARGPVRVVVRVDYDGWSSGGEKKNITSIFMQYVGGRMTEHRLLLRSAGTAQLASGIVRHAHSSVTWDPSKSLLLSFGPQARSGDDLMMALAFNSGTVVKKTETESDDLVILSIEQNRTLMIHMLAAWQGENRMALTPREVERLTTMLWQRANEPLGVSVEVKASK